MEKVDITIVGAGVVGLAVAHYLAPLAKNIVVLERESGPGRGISARNSEVIHAGLYYPADFLRTRLCVAGNPLLYEFCVRHDIPVKKIGKVVCAVEESEEEGIEKLYARAKENGCPGPRLIDGKEIEKIEPHVAGRLALYSPETGIVDTHLLVKKLEALCAASGVRLIYDTELMGLDKSPGEFLCYARPKRGESYTFLSRVVVNAAGLGAERVAALAGIDTERAGYKIHFCKGEYFQVRPSKAELVKGLVYPSPGRVLTGLGIHATKNMAGALRLGPNAFYTDRLDYDVDPAHGEEFFVSAGGLLPFLEKSDIFPDTAGIRPKLSAPGEEPRDFIIAHEEKPGLAGLIDLIGIESPGLTSCLAIGRMVTGLVGNSELI
ncbi:MAG: NAD(P)/FAD-dependent oxidoreductase [Smithellaceae bacterium]|nr:NAD(P)/FAD-dependent oxidoreductase [Smithellaceae bacterium]